MTSFAVLLSVAKQKVGKDCIYFYTSNVKIYIDELGTNSVL